MAPSCALHAGPRSVVAKLLRLGYYWPTMYSDVAQELLKCEACQIHAVIPRKPKHDMIPVTSAWPFEKWGIDIVGPFPAAPGGLKFLVVAIDYFTKWVEAKPLATITGRRILSFVWEYIVCHFGVPHFLVSDNETQFAGEPLTSWCQNLKINQIFTSVAHPQANGQVEVTNRDIVKGIKARLGKSRTGWVDELPSVLWAHRTTPKKSTGETPYSLVYGTEAVIPAELLTPIYRIQERDTVKNAEELGINAILVEERREIAAIRQAEHKAQMAKYYNRQVQAVTFLPSEYVLRRNEDSLAEPPGKLAPTWEGPYIVAESHMNGSYTLRHMDGTPIPRTWNVVHLRKCYV